MNVKKIISLLLAVTMAISVAAITPFNVSATVGRDEYELELISDDEEKPAAPTLSLSNTVNGLTAAWNKVDNAESYRVFYRSVADGEDWTSFDTTDISVLIPDAMS
jgi:hypothetical protein